MEEKIIINQKNNAKK